MAAAAYQLTLDPDRVIRTADNATIFENGAGWDQYQAWLAGGGVPDPAEDFDAMQQRYLDDLAEKSLAVERQGVDGPKSLGDPTNTFRSWPTDPEGWGRIAKVLYRREHVTAPPLPQQFRFYTLKRKATRERPGDLAGLGTSGTDNTIDDLSEAMYAHEDAVTAVVNTLWQAIKAATDEADLLAIDIEAGKADPGDPGWPPPPSNP